MLAKQLEFNQERDSDFFASVPDKPAVFLLRGEDPASEPYVTKTTNLCRRLQRLLGAQDTSSKRLNLRERVRHVAYTSTGSDFESGLVLYKALREFFPKNYADRLKLRFAPLVRLHMENRYPRASVTVKLGRRAAGTYFYGPFPSRASAEKFTNDTLDFFKMRRCVDDLNPDPAFPGCIYSEMKMCLAPCFKGCSDEEYGLEVERVRSFFDTRGESLARELRAQRSEASENLDFEAASTVHARLEKLEPLLQHWPEVVHRIDRLSALMIQPSSEDSSVTLFRIKGGCFSDPLQFSLRQEGKHHSMETRLQEALDDAILPRESTVLETMEELAILKRWYYRTQKTGEIFFADENGELPWRRVVRGVSRVYRGEKAAPDLSESAKDYWLFRGKEAGL